METAYVYVRTVKDGEQDQIDPVVQATIDKLGLQPTLGQHGRDAQHACGCATWGWTTRSGSYATIITDIVRVCPRHIS